MKVPEFSKGERMLLKVHVIDSTLFSADFRGSMINALEYIQHLEDQVAAYKKALAKWDYKP